MPKATSVSELLGQSNVAIPTLSLSKTKAGSSKEAAPQSPPKARTPSLASSSPAVSPEASVRSLKFLDEESSSGRGPRGGGAVAARVAAINATSMGGAKGSKKPSEKGVVKKEGKSCPADSAKRGKTGKAAAERCQGGKAPPPQVEGAPNNSSKTGAPGKTSKAPKTESKAPRAPRSKSLARKTPDENREKNPAIKKTGSKTTDPAKSFCSNTSGTQKNPPNKTVGNNPFLSGGRDSPAAQSLSSVGASGGNKPKASGVPRSRKQG